MLSKLRIPPEIVDFAKVFKAAGFECYLVGGAIRDLVIGRAVNDFDAATNATPEQVKRLFRKTIPTGIKHGTVTVRHAGRFIETTTYRVERGYSDGRHPDEISFSASIEEDLSRRDFTMNAIAYDPIERRVVDPSDGIGDIGARLIRAIGDPVARFSEDGLRPLRAVRFASQLGFSIDPPTLEAIPATLERFRMVAFERIREEFLKVLASPRPSPGIRLLSETGMLAHVLPELEACRGVDQKGMHAFDVFEHSLRACDYAMNEPVLRVAALLHDLGKPATQAPGEDGRFTFYRHELEGAKLASLALKRLCFPNAFIDQVAHLVKQHMFAYDSGWTDAAVRRFVARVGRENVASLFALRRADGKALADAEADERALEELSRRIDAVLAAGEALGLKDLAISGDDLKALGIPAGKAMGSILKELLEAVMDDPDLNERERLARIATKLAEKMRIEGM